MKKGIISVETMIGLALLAVIILVVIFSVRNLLSKGKDAAFSVGEGKLPGDSPLPPSYESVPLGIANDFDDFVATIKIDANKNGNRCLVPLAKMPDMKNDYFIELYPNGVSLKKKEGSEIRTYKVETIGGFETCVVAWGGAGRFYDNWLDTTIEPTPATPEYYDNPAANSLIKIKSQTKIITPNEGPNREYEISNEDGQRYLYKADSTHFCFISVRGGEDCKLRDSNKAIEKGCFGKITDTIKICGGEDKPEFMRKLIANGYRKEIRDAVVGFNNAITQAVKSTKDVCKVEFTKYPGFGNDGIVGMFKSGTSLDVEVTPNKALVPPDQIVLLQKVDNYQPCIIHGQNFWNWMWDADAVAKKNQHIDKNYVKIVGGGNNGVEFLPKDLDGKEKRDLAGDRPLIYKTIDASGNKHICIMHAFSDGWLGSNNNCEKEGDAIRNAVDDDCIYDRDTKGLKNIEVC